jgi:ketopantoate reductase
MRPRVAYDHRASMLQDVLAHRRTEIDALNGGIVAFGEQTGDHRRRSTRRSSR